jgi:DNA modification methylase
VKTTIDQKTTDTFAIYHGDTVEVARAMPSASVDFSVFSPPFASLYVYSASPRDLGNVKDDAEFFAHYDFLIAETARVMRPGRLVAIHCMLMPTSKTRDGHIGLRDFRGDIIRAYEKHGFIFHSEVCIWKDPVTAMQRTKALGLLHKTIRKDSAMSRQGIADYVVVMRSPEANVIPISHTNESFPVARWQRYASPVWVTTGEADEDGFLVCTAKETADESSGINPSNTLQHRSAREHDDERHIAPLQLSVIRRCIRLWSNPGEVVWSPFAGIGSEGYVAIQEGRRFVGAELKKSYYEQAVRNLESAANGAPQTSLFAAAEAG